MSDTPHPPVKRYHYDGGFYEVVQTGSGWIWRWEEGEHSGTSEENAWAPDEGVFSTRSGALRAAANDAYTELNDQTEATRLASRLRRAATMLERQGSSHV
jgi:hypothetical protein